MKNSITFQNEEPKKEKKREKPICHLCELRIEGKNYKDDQGLPYCYHCAVELQLDSLSPKNQSLNKDILTPGDYGFNNDIPLPTGQPFPTMLLLKYKQLLEQLVQKQNFWTKGKNVRNDGPRMWDLLQQTAAILNDPIPDNVKAKVQELQDTEKKRKKLQGMQP
jgi:hypothetical protein